MADELIDWVKVSEALHGQRNAGELTGATKAAYDEIDAQGPRAAAEPNSADIEAMQFWAGVNELEAASDEAGEHGSPAHDEWARQIRALGG